MLKGWVMSQSFSKSETMFAPCSFLADAMRIEYDLWGLPFERSDNNTDGIRRYSRQ
jgi:hypothetical protein